MPLSGQGDDLEKNKPPGRRDERYPFRKDILINESIIVKGIDISTSGIYVYTHRSFDIGKEVKVSFLAV
jgi:hypothetical protein